ncbi:MAG: alpha-ketoglutarate-dependent dioxygenase AlkB [Inquilinus limosus]|uniref:Alpha-ketoglutarate-dependent dioxygenase AlkB n=1 Tax=Inquilinus limosus TaxID=171674 RepID=A0A952KCS8_9PROT|nr:alpha-ketoglutarate-dependent dioxygenase AlkB [Inquilinus limosus]
MQPDLFGPPPLAGLATVADIVTPEEEGLLTAAIDAAPLSPFRYQGWEGRRLTATFGWRYDFEDGSFRPAEPIPDWLLPLRGKAARFAGLGPSDLAQALLIRYDPGAGIGWHKDRPVFEHVVGVSLGAAATLRLRRRQAEGGFDRRSVPLAPRSAYHLAGEARHGWEHSIPEMDATRWSVTFRSLSGRGARQGH